jgi:serine protease Do/serine protease DegQ
MIKAFAAIALSLTAATAGLAADTDPSSVAPPSGGVPSLTPVLKKITPAVVNIETRGRIPPDPKSRRRAPREVNSVGSGVVYDAQRGFIVTNNHVLEHANDITVTLTDAAC